MRLIDADELKTKLQARHDNGNEDFDKGYNVGLGTAIDLIDNAPTVEERPQVNVIPQECIKVLAETVVDVVQQIDWTSLCEKVAERPQGEWIDKRTIEHDGEFYCSNCDEVAEWLDGGSQFLSKFCPNCGADMRGGAE